MTLSDIIELGQGARVRHIHHGYGYVVAFISKRREFVGVVIEYDKFKDNNPFIAYGRDWLNTYPERIRQV